MPWGALPLQGGGSRDVALLDIALDNWFRTLLERQDRALLDGDALVELIGLALDNAVIAGESQEMAQVPYCRALFEALRLVLAAM